MPKLSNRKITKRVVDALRAQHRTRDVFVWDNELRGFGLRMKVAGSGSYLVQYRTPEGRTRRLAFAGVGSLTPEEARGLARDKLGAVKHGADPSAERHDLRKAITVAELCDLYLVDAEGRVKPSTLSMDRSRIEAHVKPLIGRRAAVGLTRADIERMQADIIAGKTAKQPKRDQDGKRIGRGGIAKGGRGVASRTVGMLGAILELGRRKSLIEKNPARGVKRAPDRKLRRFLPLEEIATLGQAMREAEAVGENPTALAAIRFLLMTGLRRMEALALPREWIDGRARCIRFEDTKSGPQLRPIGAEAMKLLDALPKREGCRWAFPASNGDGHLVALPLVLARVCSRAGLAGVTVHVLRHSFAAAAAEMGYSELTIAGLLGHAVRGVTARYAHVPDAALVAAADRVAARIAAALGGNIPDAKVASLADHRAVVESAGASG